MKKIQSTTLALTAIILTACGGDTGSNSTVREAVNVEVTRVNAATADLTDHYSGTVRKRAARCLASQWAER